MRKWLVVLALAWCAVDLGGRVYACFGFDLDACEKFTQLFTGQAGQMLVCRIR